MNFCTVEQAISDIQAGKMLIVVDDENRENEGDFFLAAELIDEEKLNFLTREGRGLICAPITTQKAEKLNLSYMSRDNTSPLQTAFTISIDAKEGITTGISAADRTLTLKNMANPDAQATDFGAPGHIFPLIAQDNGVLTRPGHTEAMVDLLKLANLEPVGVICEILNPDGSMARMDDLQLMATRLNINVLRICDLIDFRISYENVLEFQETIKLPTEFGEFDLSLFYNPIDDKEVVCLSKGDISNGQDVLTRVHSSCLTGDLFHSLKCDCKNQLQTAMKKISEKGHGLVIYLEQEGRGIGLANKLKTYKLQDQGLDTVDANTELGLPVDAREYWEAYQVLKHFDIHNIELLTNNPKKIQGLQKFGINVLRMPINTKPHHINHRYLDTKRRRLGHLLATEVLNSNPSNPGNIDESTNSYH